MINPRHAERFSELALELESRPGFNAHSMIEALRIPQGTMTKSGTAYQWFNSHHSNTVNTVQLSGDTGIFAPMNRDIDASRKSYVSLGDSRRDYAGLTVEHCDEFNLIVSTTFGESPVTILYSITD